MNACRQYVGHLIQCYAAHEDAMEAVSVWRHFYEVGVEFERVDWSASKQLGKEHGTQLKECFVNCARIAAVRPDLTYYEGMAGMIIPTDHAWLVTSEGVVLDPTYCWMHSDDEPVSYFGIPLTLKDLKAKREWFISAYIAHIRRKLRHAVTKPCGCPPNAVCYCATDDKMKHKK